MAKAGTLIAGRYRLLSPLGKGGMGTVWRAHHLELGSQVAVKLIDTDMVDSPEMQTRFRREAKLAAALRSKYVVQVFDHGVDDGVPYLVMELLEGESLAERLGRTGPMPLAEVQWVLTCIAKAVGKAHDMGFVHRDLKPSNIFLSRADDEETVKVLDFGIAKAVGQQEPSVTTSSRRVLGTLYYMSPEQGRGAAEVDWRTDLWAMGVIAYECAVGRHPFHSEGIWALMIRIVLGETPVPSEHASLPTEFDAWFAKACAKDREERFQSAKEMVEALGQALGHPQPRYSSACPRLHDKSASLASEAPVKAFSTRVEMSYGAGPARARRVGGLRLAIVGAAVVGIVTISAVVFALRQGWNTEDLGRLPLPESASARGGQPDAPLVVPVASAEAPASSPPVVGKTSASGTPAEPAAKAPNEDPSKSAVQKPPPRGGARVGAQSSETKPNRPGMAPSLPPPEPAPLPSKARSGENDWGF